MWAYIRVLHEPERQDTGKEEKLLIIIRTLLKRDD
jgi:hypothetical protein